MDPFKGALIKPESSPRSPPGHRLVQWQSFPGELAVGILTRSQPLLALNFKGQEFRGQGFVGLRNLGFRNLGFRAIQGLGVCRVLAFRDQEFRVQGLGFGNLRFKVEGAEFEVQGSGILTLGQPPLAFRVEGLIISELGFRGLGFKNLGLRVY